MFFLNFQFLKLPVLTNKGKVLTNNHTLDHSWFSYCPVKYYSSFPYKNTFPFFPVLDYSCDRMSLRTRASNGQKEVIAKIEFFICYFLQCNHFILYTYVLAYLLCLKAIQEELL